MHNVYRHVPVYGINMYMTPVIRLTHFAVVQEAGLINTASKFVITSPLYIQEIKPVTADHMG